MKKIEIKPRKGAEYQSPDVKICTFSAETQILTVSQGTKSPEVYDVDNEEFSW